MVGPTTESLIAQFPELARVDVEPVRIDGRHGGIDARQYRADESNAALVWLHGGAFIFGDLDMAEAHWVSLALAARGVAVLSVEYRKAVGGVRYPIPSDDVLDAWLWAEESRARFGSPESLHLGGASAGGCLAAGVAKRLRDSHDPLPSSLVLVYPLTHPRLPPASEAVVRALAAAPPYAVISKDASVDDVARNYAGDDKMNDPYAFPALGDLGGLPPVYIVNCEFDSIRRSGEAFAVALAEAGADVRCDFEPGTVHGHLDLPSLPGALRTIDRIVDWISTRR